MADRVLVWYLPEPGASTPIYYMDRAYTPQALRIYAERAPDKDLVVDILADGVSIMEDNNYAKWTFKNEAGYIEFGTPSGTFTVNETVTGGTSGATATVVSNKFGRLTLTNVSSTNFTTDESISGGSSSATGVVNAYVKPIKNSTKEIKAGQSLAMLVEKQTSNDMAENFKAEADLPEGTWVSLSVLDMAGASGVTVQLELEAIGESTLPRR